MICRNCKSKMRDKARFCNECGERVAGYDPPEGFLLDPNSQLYYRSEFDAGGAQRVTWFDSSTGTCEEVSYPAEQGAPAQGHEEIATPMSEPESPPMAEPKPEPEPEPTSKPEPAPPPTAPKIDVPDGFISDPSSGLYYKAMPGKDPATGASGIWYTWFYPESGDFQQQFHPD